MAVTRSGTAKVTLPGDRQILITREFDAPKHLVWEAWTTPELVKRWWHANRGEVTLAEIDDQPSELVRVAMVRAKMAERIAGALGTVDPEAAFTVGLFSVLDALMSMRMEDVLSELPQEWQERLARWGRLNETHRRQVDDVTAPDPNEEYLLYQTLLGAAFFRLPDALRALHGVHGTARYSGQVTVVRGTGLLSRLCARERFRRAAGRAWD